MAEFFISAGAAGEDRPTVVIPADTIPGEKPINQPSRDIAKQLKVGRPTGKQKKGEEYTIPQKPWLMHLQHMHPGMIGYLKITRLSSLVVIFAVEKVWLCSIFPDGAMEKGIPQPISSQF